MPGRTASTGTSTVAGDRGRGGGRFGGGVRGGGRFGGGRDGGRGGRGVSKFGGGRGGRGGRGGMKGGAKVVIEAHRHEGVFIARGKEDALVTKNLVPGVTLFLCATYQRLHTLKDDVLVIPWCQVSAACRA